VIRSRHEPGARNLRGMARSPGGDNTPMVWVVVAFAARSMSGKSVRSTFRGVSGSAISAVHRQVSARYAGSVSDDGVGRWQHELRVASFRETLPSQPWQQVLSAARPRQKSLMSPLEQRQNDRGAPLNTVSGSIAHTSAARSRVPVRSVIAFSSVSRVGRPPVFTSVRRVVRVRQGQAVVDLSNYRARASRTSYATDT
jgi:hypothetical protein